MSDELKPCPFCNGEGVIYEYSTVETCPCSMRPAQPAEAEGVEVVAAFVYDNDMLLCVDFDPKARMGTADGTALVHQSDHLAALSAVTAERDRLRSKWARVESERDQLRAKVEMLREDAERWRYVSLQGDDTHWLNLLRVDLDDFGGNINAAVDALIDGEAPALAAKEA
ncbi:hypothetical protein [Stutzerimonas nitrititolerans]|uniref:Restriction alleviation protein Lar n=1 Tax=Stutzerimonas nitrititolerans TaxID=2482751 RepID=A0ABX9V3V9_9GAMM|nr:hypothetical protein [Stutzerimonas nitrititolerans]RMI00484.1 hypothetical protein EA795_13270 [Stutzerimonas nitrititolerans]